MNRVHPFDRLRTPHLAARLLLAIVFLVTLSAAATPTAPASTLSPLPASARVTPAEFRAEAGAISGGPSLAADLDKLSLPERSGVRALPAQVTDLPGRVDWRTANSATFKVGEGRYATVIGAEPLHYQDASGAWQAINPAFQTGWESFYVQRNSTRSRAGLHSDWLSAGDTACPLLNKPELTSLRSAYARHYDLGNGKRVAVVGAAALNYQDAKGDWQPIQPVFTRAENGWRVPHNTLRSRFAGDSTAVQLESNGEIIGWQPVALEINDDAGNVQQLAVPVPGEAVQAEAVGRQLRYASAWSDATLIKQFHSSAGTLEQELILAQAPVVAAEGE